MILAIKTVKGKRKKTKHKNWITVHSQQHWEKERLNGQLHFECGEEEKK